MKKVARYTDMAFCLFLLPLMMYAFPVERWWGVYPVFFGAFLAWLYLSYFIYKYFVVPGIFRGNRRRWQALSVVALSVCITALFSTYPISSPYYHVHQQLIEQSPYPQWGFRPNQQAIWLYFILVVMFCFAVGTLHEVYRQRLAREEMEFERNRAELSLYKAQINPHFLFNTLNTIYGLLITHSDKTVATLEQFIDLTKYLYNNANREFISLAEETDYIGQYIALQQLRLNEFAQVEYTTEMEDESMLVPPMMLITFVENAFKYGISSNDPCFVRIHLTQQADTLCFEVENSVFESQGTVSNQMGLDNCRRRLSLLYPGRHSLYAQRCDAGTFRVRLELKNDKI